MMVMCGQSNPIWHYWAGRYPRKIGVLFGPAYYKKLKLRPWMPFALDNDAYSAFSRNTPWDEQAWLKMLDAIARTRQMPLWVLVPDVVANRAATLESWSRYVDTVKAYGWTLAFAVQDGMTATDVPSEAEVIFVGGTTKWKWRTLRYWTEHFERCHVGRVNWERLLWMAHESGAESCDGSAWFFGGEERWKGLERYLDHSTNGRPQLELDIPTDADAPKTPTKPL